MKNKTINKETSLKNQEKVLNYIISCPINNCGYNIMHPKNFKANFPYITSPEALKTILVILNDKGLIEADFDESESGNIVYTITALPKGYDYSHQTRKEKFAFWLPLISSSILSASAIVVSLLTLLLR